MFRHECEVIIDPKLTALTAFVFVFGGALVGMRLRAFLPEHHLNAESKYIVKLGIGLVGTMVALLLGLLIASARDFYDGQRKELAQLSAKIVVLDRILARYGPEAQEARSKLREAVVQGFEDRAITGQPMDSQLTSRSSTAEVYDRILGLTPQDDFHREVKTQALRIGLEIGNLRWTMFAERNTAISVPMLVTVIFWLTIIFVSFGLFAPPNATVIVTLALCSIAVSIAIFLILELYTPYEGWIQLSLAPVRSILEQLGR